MRRRGAVPDILAGAQHAVLTSANEYVVQPISLGEYLRRIRQHRPYPPGGGDRGHRRTEDHRADGMEGIRIQGQARCRGPAATAMGPLSSAAGLADVVCRDLARL